MKKIIRNILLLAVMPGMTSLVSCSHEHEPIGNYDYDYAEHWHYCICGEELDKGKHTIGEECTCTVCGYVDPIYITNEVGVLTDLTPYGKTVNYVEISLDVVSIRKGAFDNSKCTNVYIPMNVLSIDKGVFEKLPITLTFEEKDVKWVETETAYVKSWVFDTYECFIDDVPFKTIKMGIDSIRDNNKTVYLLNDVIAADEIDVRYEITISTTALLLQTMNLKANFNVYDNGGITFDDSCVFKGNVNLILREYENDAFSSGYVMFENMETAPEEVKVYYQDKRTSTTVTKEAQGAPQVYGKILTSKTYFTFGTFIFTRDYAWINGLTSVGTLITELYINSPFKEQSIGINTHAFCFLANVEIPIMSFSIGINIWMQKGIYSSVKLGEGLSTVRSEAFSDKMDTKFNKDLTLLLAKILYPFKKLDLGDSNVTLESRAFGYCYSLESVTCGSGIKMLPNGCFVCDYNLKEANLENATSLDKIDEFCFYFCDSLNSVRLNNPIEWHFYNYRHYRVEDMTPDMVAELLRSTFLEYAATRERSNSEKPFTYYNPSVVDQRGRPYDVFMANSLEEAINKAPDNGVIQLVKSEYKLSEKKEIRINKNITIDSSLFEGKKGVIENVDLIVEKNKKVVFTNKVEFKGNIYLASNYDSLNMHHTSVGSVACEVDSNKKWALENAKVLMEQSKSTELKALECYKDAVEYKGYALQNFYCRPSNDICEELSAAGLMMTKMVVASQSKDNTYCNFGCLNNNQNLKEIVFSSEVHYINANALDSSKIEKVTIGSSVNKLYESSFKNCKNLVSVDLSHATSLLEVNNEAFWGCSNLKEINLSACGSFREISSGAFNNTGLTRIVLPFTNNWKANDVAIDESKLSTPEKVAQLLNGGEYKTSRLTR